MYIQVEILHLSGCAGLLWCAKFAHSNCRQQPIPEFFLNVHHGWYLIFWERELWTWLPFRLIYNSLSLFRQYSFFSLPLLTLFKLSFYCRRSSLSTLLHPKIWKQRNIYNLKWRNVIKTFMLNQTRKLKALLKESSASIYITIIDNMIRRIQLSYPTHELIQIIKNLPTNSDLLKNWSYDRTPFTVKLSK